MRRSRFCGIFLFLCFLSTTIWAQVSDPSLSILSSSAYSKEAAAISARKVPNKYNSKAQQRIYEAFIQRRNESLAAQLTDDGIVADAAALARCNAILQRMQRSSPAYPFSEIRVFINRSATPNASCYGEGTLQVNLGLLLLVSNDDELAFVMGHELAHQFLGHLESRISRKVSQETDADLRKEVRAINRSSGSRYEKLRALQAQLAAEQGAFGRHHEEEADGLGLLLTRSAGYDPQKGARLLLRFQYVDDLFAGKELYNVGQTFAPAGIVAAAPAKVKYVGLSSVKVTINANATLDSLRLSHPDCVVRWQHLNGGPTSTPPSIENMQAMLARPDAYKQTAFAEMVRYLFESRRLTLAIHMCLLAKANGCNSPYFDNFLAASFAQIVGEEATGKRFEATHAGVAIQGSTLKELEDLVGEQNNEATGKIAAYFLQQHPEQQTESALLARALYAQHIEGKPVASAMAVYLAAYPNGSFASQFKNQ